MGCGLWAMGQKCVRKVHVSLEVLCPRAEEVTLFLSIITGAEAYGLTAQLRRAAASIPANIAEGCGRRGDIEFSRFVRISLGSATELEYHLLLCHDIGLLKASTFESLSAQVIRMQGMLAGLSRVLKPHPSN